MPSLDRDRGRYSRNPSSKKSSSVCDLAREKWGDDAPCARDDLAGEESEPKYTEIGNGGVPATICGSNAPRDMVRAVLVKAMRACAVRRDCSCARRRAACVRSSSAALLLEVVGEAMINPVPSLLSLDS